MQAEAEQRWERALETPLEGVQFTYEEFADALSKYDFSFEIGDTVISSSTGSPYL
jgi:small subunit ribosomal protein S1